MKLPLNAPNNILCKHKSICKGKIFSSKTRFLPIFSLPKEGNPHRLAWRWKRHPQVVYWKLPFCIVQYIHQPDFLFNRNASKEYIPFGVVSFQTKPPWEPGNLSTHSLKYLRNTHPQDKKTRGHQQNISGLYFDRKVLSNIIQQAGKKFYNNHK